MPKELPYFKFYTSEWLDGNITLESFEDQGVFINVCAHYWNRSGNVTERKLRQRFKHCELSIQELIDEEFIKLNKDGSVSISFLDEQLKEREKRLKTNRENGKLGGRPKSKETHSVTDKETHSVTDKETHSVTHSDNKEKPNENRNGTNIEKKREEKKREEDKEPRALSYNSTKEEFRAAAEKYFKMRGNISELDKFVGYWCQINQLDDSMLWQSKKYFDLAYRVNSWIDRGSKTKEELSIYQDVLDHWIIRSEPTKAKIDAAKNFLSKYTAEQLSPEELLKQYQKEMKNGSFKNLTQTINRVLNPKPKNSLPEPPKDDGPAITPEELEKLRKDKGL